MRLHIPETRQKLATQLATWFPNLLIAEKERAQWHHPKEGSPSCLMHQEGKKPPPMQALDMPLLTHIPYLRNPITPQQNMLNRLYFNITNRTNGGGSTPSRVQVLSRGHSIMKDPPKKINELWRSQSFPKTLPKRLSGSKGDEGPLNTNVPNILGVIL